MKNTNENPRYALIVEWSDEDNCYVGRCPELFLGGVHGDNRDAVYKDLCAAVDEAIEARKSIDLALPPALSGKTFSGKFLVRIAPGLHKQLAIKATRRGESLNAFVERKLQEH
jgi:predicted HicB family RNase H-like nuclease